MTLLDRIPEGVMVALDTAPWIYALESHPQYSPILKPLFDERFAAGLNRAGASLLALAEVLVQPLAQGRRDIANSYRRFFADAARVAAWPIEQQVVELAAELRVRRRLRMIDALHVASAIHFGAATFVTNDTAMRRVTEIPVLVLEDFLTQAAAP